MTDWAAEISGFFIAYDREISVLSIISSVLILGFRRKWRMKLEDILTAGALGAGLPLGVLLILTAWMPEIAQKVEFPPQIAILGCVYLYFAGRMLARFWKTGMWKGGE